MSSLLGQVILHPKVSQAMAVLATTIGRDKVRPVAGRLCDNS